jgi:hypothetical protein
MHLLSRVGPACMAIFASEHAFFVRLGEVSAPAAKKRSPAPKLQQQMERIQHLPRAQQRFVMQVIDTVLAQQGC